MAEVIKSVYSCQHECLSAICELYSIDRIGLDMTYGNGSFYKMLDEPVNKIDIDPQFDDVIECDSGNMVMIEDNSQTSAIFDPPFLTYIRQGREGNGDMIMGKRFAGYWTYADLARHYTRSISEANRVLKTKGIFIIKCQDIVHNHKLHPTHVNIIEWARGMFSLKDFYILTANHRLPSPNRAGKQKHARIFHSYFMVMVKL